MSIVRRLGLLLTIFLFSVQAFASLETINMRCEENRTPPATSPCVVRCSWDYHGPVGAKKPVLIGGRSYQLSVKNVAVQVIPFCAVTSALPSNLETLGIDASAWNASTKTLTLPDDASGSLSWEVSGTGSSGPVAPGSLVIYSGLIDSDFDGVNNFADHLPFNSLETLDSDGDTFGDNVDAFPFDPAEKIIITSKEVPGSGGLEHDYFYTGPDELEPGKSYYFCNSSGDLNWSPELPLEYFGQYCMLTVPYTFDVSPSSKNPDFTVLLKNFWAWGGLEGNYIDATFSIEVSTTANPDLDADGYDNDVDEFPIDGQEWADTDGDGWGDNADPYPFSQDGDNDKDLDPDDNCPTISNYVQSDSDNDGIGNACDDDIDGDGVLNINDAHPLNPNAAGDADFDGVDLLVDNCPSVSNYVQSDSDNDGIGNACDPDVDGDGVDDVSDSHPLNPLYYSDFDRDLVNAESDNCPDVSNYVQSDSDGDGIGNACDPDVDGDGVNDVLDNYPLNPNIW